jgi:hypothetical protein
VLGAFLQGFDNRFRAWKIHVRHPHGQDPVAAETGIGSIFLGRVIRIQNKFPFNGTGLAPVYLDVEVCRHRSFLSFFVLVMACGQGEIKWTLSNKKIAEIFVP